MTRKITQRNKIRAHLHYFGQITPLDALKTYGCFRLAAIIFLLRKEGMKIRTETSDDDKNYATYVLEDK